MINELFNKKRILVIAAHPDDEVLGVGGTIHRLSQRHQCTSKALVLGEGITSRGEKDETDKWAKELEIHRKSISLAAQCLSYSSTEVYNFPDNRFDSVDLLDIIKIVEKEVHLFKPDIIFTHHGRDLNVDHQKTFEAVMTATRPLPGIPPVILLSFETLSSTEWQVAEPHEAFLPNFFMPILLKDLEAKQAAMKCYAGECRDYPHPRSLRSLEIAARRWGTVIGVEFAEAFRVIRWVVKEE